MSPESYRALHTSLAAFIPDDRLITDPLRLLTWGTDASFYRLVPAIAVVVEEDHPVRLCRAPLPGAPLWRLGDPGLQVRPAVALARCDVDTLLGPIAAGRRA